MASTTKIVIYSPPKAGLPYLVVTIAGGEIVHSAAVASRDAARAMIAQNNTFQIASKQRPSGIRAKPRDLRAAFFDARICGRRFRVRPITFDFTDRR